MVVENWIPKVVILATCEIFRSLKGHNGKCAYGGGGYGISRAVVAEVIFPFARKSTNHQCGR